ncbi:MAG: hypothetical protein ACOC8N_06295 [Spirochaetota bacterium]
MYRETSEGRKFVNTFTMEPLSGSPHLPGERGTYVRIVSREDGREHKLKELWLDEELATVRWHYRHRERGTDLTAWREGNVILLEGSHEGEEVRRRFEIDDLPWRQQFPLDLEQFARSDRQSTMFWAIGTDGPAGLKAAKFIAVKKEQDTITVNGETCRVRRIRISFYGLLSIFWHGDSWHRCSDGEYIRFRSSEAPGHPPALLELVRKL